MSKKKSAKNSLFKDNNTIVMFCLGFLGAVYWRRFDKSFRLGFHKSFQRSHHLKTNKKNYQVGLIIQAVQKPSLDNLITKKIFWKVLVSWKPLDWSMPVNNSYAKWWYQMKINK